MRKLNYQLEEFVDLFSGDILQSGADTRVDSILIDSRRIGLRKHTCFFALKGKVHNGHNYISQLYKNGIRAFVISDDLDLSNYPDANFIKVSNTLQALQTLAKNHRHKYDIPVIGITGSNAKTIVKEWLYECLYDEFKTVRSPKSYNSQVGVPLSVLNLSSEHNLAIFEAGISKPGEMINLESIISPNIGIFTNIGQAHQENFQSLEEKVKEKAKLFEHSQTIIYCSDHELIRKEIESAYPKKDLWSWSLTDKSARVNIDQIGKFKFKVKCDDSEIDLELPHSSSVDIENACHVLVCLLFLGIEPTTIASKMTRLKPINMRFEKLEGINNCVIINDSYNADLNSLNIALDQLMMQKGGRSNTIILSDIYESGLSDDQLYREVESILASKLPDKIIAIGTAISKSGIERSFDNINVFPNTGAFIAQFDRDNFRNENILLKGARTFQFEQIVDLLQEQIHETVLEVNMEAMAENLSYIRSLLNPDVKIMAMVKAFAYGAGSYDVARFLEYNGVEYLSVAYIDEGVELRQKGITIPIMVLNPEVSGYATLIRHNLEPQLYSFRTLHAFQNAISRYEFGEAYPVHLMINTGMNRLGFDENDMDELLNFLNQSEGIRVVSVFSHLAASDDSAFTEFTKKQIALFKSIVERFTKEEMSPMAHILNSAGILRFPDAQFSMVRLGLALYGLSSVSQFKHALKPVSTLKTTISQIRNVDAGEGIGYSPKELLSKKTIIATIAIGYADGLMRSLGNGNGHVMIKGQKAPFIGNICMDMAMIDVSEIECEEGDEVEVFGPNKSIYSLAKELNTIPYEVLTSISGRVKRVFVH